MSDNPPRLRMFAGPNGSGKTTIKVGLQKTPEWFGIYINPDELEAEAKRTSQIDTRDWSIDFSNHELQQHLCKSNLLISKNLVHQALQSITCERGIVYFSDLNINSYHSAVLADFFRRKAIELRRSFSFETVMSSGDKIDLLRLALESGYRTYLYFIATDNVEINIARVKARVESGGHNVPEQKIRERYERSIKLLPLALQYTTKAYIFDTSQEILEPCNALNSSWVAKTNQKDIYLVSSEIPTWFLPVWNSFEEP